MAPGCSVTAPAFAILCARVHHPIWGKKSPPNRRTRVFVQARTHVYMRNVQGMSTQIFSGWVCGCALWLGTSERLGIRPRCTYPTFAPLLQEDGVASAWLSPAEPETSWGAPAHEAEAQTWLEEKPHRWPKPTGWHATEKEAIVATWKGLVKTSARISYTHAHLYKHAHAYVRGGGWGGVT